MTDRPSRLAGWFGELRRRKTDITTGDAGG
jgi:hypothetical protein